MKWKSQLKGVTRVLHQINSKQDEIEFIKTLPKRMDFSCVRTAHDEEELKNLIEAAKKYRPACAFTLPSFAGYLTEKLAGVDGVKTGGVVSFPSGGDTTDSKVFQTKELCGIGCGEIDMVMNLTMLKTKRYQSCSQDIREVVEAAGRIPVKVIIEACLLTEDEICRASELAVQAGAAFVKTGTGWIGPAAVKQVELIYQTIGNDAFIKAAGGIRSLAAMIELYKAGCDRFGIGADPAADILREADFDKTG
jgi:deoxyribose-phosphate aldolase